MRPETIDAPVLALATVTKTTSLSLEKRFADVEHAGGAELARRRLIEHLTGGRKLGRGWTTTIAVDERRSARERTFDVFEPAMEPR